MAVAHVPIDSSVVALSSVATAAIAYAFFLKVVELSPLVCFAISAGIGVVLFMIGIVPIGHLALVGVGMLIAIGRTVMGGRPPPS